MNLTLLDMIYIAGCNSFLVLAVLAVVILISSAGVKVQADKLNKAIMEQEVRYKTIKEQNGEVPPNTLNDWRNKIQ